MKKQATLSPTAISKLIMPTTSMSMEASLFSVKPPDENAALVDTLIKAFQRTQLNRVETPDLKKLWDNTYVLFLSALYMVTWYTACKTNAGRYASYGVLHIQYMGELSRILCTEREMSSWSQFFLPHDNSSGHGLSPLLRRRETELSEFWRIRTLDTSEY